MSFTGKDLVFDYKNPGGPSGIRISLDFNRLIERLGSKWKETLTEALPQLASKANSLAPVGKTGNLSQSVKYSVKEPKFGDMAKGYIYSRVEGPRGSKYALWVEIGTGFHPHSRYKKRQVSGHRRKKIQMTPGIRGIYRKPQPYLFPAVMSVKATLLSKLGDGNL